MPAITQLPKLPATAFQTENSADSNRVFLWEACDEPPHVRAVLGWKMIGHGKAPYSGSCGSEVAVMFEKQTPEDREDYSIKGGSMPEGTRIWHHFALHFLNHLT